MNPATVCIIDDDASMRTALNRLLKLAGYRVNAFPSAEVFLESGVPDEPCCLIVDVRMPGMSGLDLQETLSRQNPDLPIVFVTGHGDIRMAVRAVQAGAVEFLPKPFKSRELLAAVEKALERHRHALARQREIGMIRRRVDSLTPREREVMEGILAGMPNKQIAQQLGIVEQTIKVHRARVMEKMGASSVAALVRMAAEAGVHGVGTSNPSRP